MHRGNGGATPEKKKKIVGGGQTTSKTHSPDSNSPFHPFGLGTDRSRPHRLNFLWAPHKLIFTVIVQIGILDEPPALSLIEDSEQKVVENAVLDLWELSVDESLLQEEADQGGLVVRVPQGSLALQDTGDAQAVVSVTVKDKQ